MHVLRDIPTSMSQRASSYKTMDCRVAALLAKTEWGERLLCGLQVVFLAEFVQEFELGFQPVDVFFFGF